MCMCVCMRVHNLKSVILESSEGWSKQHHVPRGSRTTFQLQKPFLPLAPGSGRENGIKQLHHFTLTAFYVGDVPHLCEHHTCYAFHLCRWGCTLVGGKVLSIHLGMF